jgi:hypothetical protein
MVGVVPWCSGLQCVVLDGWRCTKVRWFTVCSTWWLVVIPWCACLQCVVPDGCCGTMVYWFTVSSTWWLGVLDVLPWCTGLQCVVPDGWCGTMVCRGWVRSWSHGFSSVIHHPYRVSHTVLYAQEKGLEAGCLFMTPMVPSAKTMFKSFFQLRPCHPGTNYFNLKTNTKKSYPIQTKHWNSFKISA